MKVYVLEVLKDKKWVPRTDMVWILRRHAAEYMRLLRERNLYSYRVRSYEPSARKRKGKP